MKLQQFQGGVASRLRPQFINQNQGVEYQNIDNSTGTLTPVKKSTPSGIFLDFYHTYFDAAQQWVSSVVRRDYVEYKGDLYWTDRSSTPQKYSGTTQTNLGIVVPPTLDNFTVSSLSIVTEATVSSVAGAGIPDEDTRYILVNADATLGLSNMYEVLVPANGIAKIVGSNLSSLVKRIAVLTGTSSLRTTTIANPVVSSFGSLGVEVYREYKSTFYLVGTLATASSSITDPTLDISGNKQLDLDSIGALQGTYQYQLTYYNSLDGTESGPSPISSEVDVSEGGFVALANIHVSSDPQVDKKRLYRIGGNLTTPTLVIELTNGTTAYLDQLKDTEVEGTLLLNTNTLPAPTGIAYLTEAYAMLFAAQGSRLRFTPIGEPTSWPELFFLQFDANITGLAAATNGLLVFTKFKTFLVTGTGPLSLTQQTLSTDQGCLAYESIQSIKGAILWLSSDGLCTSSGNNVVVISKDTIGKLVFDAIDSVIYDEVYYAVNNEGLIFSFDFAYGKIFKYLLLGVTSLAVANDILYGWANGELQQLFNSSEFEKFSYKSPRFIEGSATEQKTYKNVRIYHKGDIIIKVYINDNLVATSSLNGENKSIIKVPQELQRGTFIQFEIEGTGEVYEYEYRVGRAQNG